MFPLAFLLLNHLQPQQVQGHVIDLIVHHHHHQVVHNKYKAQALRKGDAQKYLNLQNG